MRTVSPSAGANGSTALVRVLERRKSGMAGRSGVGRENAEARRAPPRGQPNVDGTMRGASCRGLRDPHAARRSTDGRGARAVSRTDDGGGSYGHAERDAERHYLLRGDVAKRHANMSAGLDDGVESFAEPTQCPGGRHHLELEERRRRRNGRRGANAAVHELEMSHRDGTLAISARDDNRYAVCRERAEEIAQLI